VEDAHTHCLLLCIYGIAWDIEEGLFFGDSTTTTTPPPSSSTTPPPPSPSGQ